MEGVLGQLAAAGRHCFLPSELTEPVLGHDLPLRQTKDQKVRMATREMARNRRFHFRRGNPSGAHEPRFRS